MLCCCYINNEQSSLCNIVIDIINIVKIMQLLSDLASVLTVFSINLCNNKYYGSCCFSVVCCQNICVVSVEATNNVSIYIVVLHPTI